MTDPPARERRSFLALTLLSPVALLGCGGSQDGTNIQIGEATKAEVKARAAMYKNLKKSKAAPKR